MSKRKKYSSEFKREAIELVRRSSGRRASGHQHGGALKAAVTQIVQRLVGLL